MSVIIVSKDRDCPAEIKHINQISLLSYNPSSFAQPPSYKNFSASCIQPTHLLAFMRGPNNKIPTYGSVEICFDSTINCTHLLSNNIQVDPKHCKAIDNIVHHNPWVYPELLLGLPAAGIPSRVRGKQTICYLYI